MSDRIASTCMEESNLLGSPVNVKDSRRSCSAFECVHWWEQRTVVVVEWYYVEAKLQVFCSC